MTSTDVRASRAAKAAGGMRVLRVLAVALSLGVAVMALSAAPVFAATSSTEAGYNEKPPAPEEESSYKEKPPAPSQKEKVAPAKEEVAPEKEAVAPEKEAVAPASEAAPETSELPFTGLDLRWVVGVGLLLIAAGGVSLAITRRRERHGTGR